MPTRTEILRRIDHTLLQPGATARHVEVVASEAVEYGFASVCVNPCFVSQVRERLEGTTVNTCSVAGFPFGANTTAIKVAEARLAVEQGADEVDFVAFLPSLLECDYDAAVREFATIVDAVRDVRRDAVVKVIIESALLMMGVDEGLMECRIEVACRAANEAGCDFVKTSTGVHAAGGATVEAVGLMKRYGRGVMVKASGGIRSYDDAVGMIEAGADRLGCSASVAIVNGAPK